MRRWERVGKGEMVGKGEAVGWWVKMGDGRVCEGERG